MRAGGARRLDAAQAEALMARLQRDAARIAGHFRLVYRALVAERATAARHYGLCTEDGLIRIRLQHATRGTELKYSSLVHTLCHELAHLRHFDHGEEFRGFLARVLGWARREGIYRPGRSGQAAPPLPEDCGVEPEVRRQFLEQMRRAAQPPRRSPPGE